MYSESCEIIIKHILEFLITAKRKPVPFSCYLPLPYYISYEPNVLSPPNSCIEI